MKQSYLIIYQSLSTGNTSDIKVREVELSGKIEDIKAGDNKILNVVDTQTLRGIRTIN